MVRKRNFAATFALLILVCLSTNALATLTLNAPPYFVDPASEDRSQPEFDSAKFFLKQAFASFGQISPNTVMILGWDTGRLSQFAAMELPKAQILNVPVTPAFIDYACEYYPHNRVENLPLSQLNLDSTDLLFSSWVVGFVPQEQQVSTIQQWRSLLKSDGVLAVLYPIRGSLLSEAIQQVVSSDEWRPKFQLQDVAKRQSYSAEEYAQLMRLAASWRELSVGTQLFTTQFEGRDTFAPFVRTAISRYVPFLQETEIQSLINSVVDRYLGMLPASELVSGAIPYSVNMVFAIGRK